jgi:hypothetical protein
VTLALLGRRSNGRSAERFRCAEAIARCGELGGVARGRGVAERGTQTALVVIGGSSGRGGGLAAAGTAVGCAGAVLVLSDGVLGIEMYSGPVFRYPMDFRDF